MKKTVDVIQVSGKRVLVRLDLAEAPPRSLRPVSALSAVTVRDGSEASLRFSRCLDGKAKRLVALFLMLASLTVAGCAAREPLDAWQRRLARYVEKQGGGDPAVLRDLPDRRSTRGLRPGEIVFGALDVPGPGLPLFQTHWDVQGVLVGQQTVHGGRWCFFVVGRLSRPPDGPVVLDDVRLTAFRMEGRWLRWVTGDADPAATSRYADLAAAAPTFPRAHDVFTFTMRGDEAVVREERSGASWTLRVAASESRPDRVADVTGPR